MQAWADPVRWRPREWNKGADHLCNVSMDERISKTEVDIDELAYAIKCGCNIQIHSDGGLRRGYGASMAWTIAVWHHDDASSEWQRSLVGKQRMFLEQCKSSFVAETLALEAAIDTLSSILW